jgi:hypothetical protein
VLRSQAAARVINAALDAEDARSDIVFDTITQRTCFLSLDGSIDEWRLGLPVRAASFLLLQACQSQRHENAKAIEAWRATLPARQRRRLVHPLSNVRRWRAATTHNGKCPTDLRRDAVAAWKRFVWCVRSLPPHEAAPFCQTALAEVLLI